MRVVTYCLLLIIPLAILFGCNKGQDSRLPFHGYWELRRDVGPNGEDTSYPRGNGMIQEFTETEWRWYDTGVVSIWFPYRLIHDSSQTTHQMEDMIEYTDMNGRHPRFLYSVIQDSLILTRDNTGGISGYRRIDEK